MDFDGIKNSIVIASNHSRNFLFINQLVELLPEFEIFKVSSQAELSFNMLEKILPKFVFFPHWSYIIPAEIYNRFNCIIFHMTDLPYGRGGSPLQNLIVRGHKSTMLSALKCVKEIDAGPIYLKQPLSLEGTAEEILTDASHKIAGMIAKIVKLNLQPVEQIGEVTHFKRRLPSQGDLNTVDTLSKVYDYIRMLDADGYPKAFLSTEYHIFEFSDAVFNTDSLEAKVCIKKKNL